MKYEIKVLPLEEAIKLEAKQNIERDIRVLGDEEPDDEMEAIYEEEARTMLTEFGQGYYPEYPDHYLVQVAK